jgi:beta-N-acetylglucosaminidase
VIHVKLKPWLFILVSALVITGVLALAANSEARENEIRELERECEQQLQQLREMRQQLQKASDRLEELETMLLNLRYMERIVTGSAISSRGGRITLATMPVTTPSGFSAARFERAFAGTPLAGIGEALVEAERETGINALVLAGIIAHETGWGTSALARDKNNMAGLGAYDGAEYSSGITFASRAESVMYLAQLLATHYAPGGKYFGGSFDLTGVGVRYASDPRWAAKVAGCVKYIVKRSGENGR